MFSGSVLLLFFVPFSVFVWPLCAAELVLPVESFANSMGAFGLVCRRLVTIKDWSYTSILDAANFGQLSPEQDQNHLNKSSSPYQAKVIQGALPLVVPLGMPTADCRRLEGVVVLLRKC